MFQQETPTLSRRLVGNLAITFAAIALVCAALVMATLYLNFERSMGHETAEALSHYSQEVLRLRDDMLFHSDTLTMVAGWNADGDKGREHVEALDAHLSSWFNLSGVEFVGTGLPEEWRARGYDLSVFSGDMWNQPQVALHSRKSGEAEMLVVIPDVGSERGSLMLVSHKLDNAWMRMTAGVVEAQVGICDLNGKVVTSSFPTLPPHTFSVGSEAVNFADIGQEEYAYKTQRLSIGNRSSVYFVTFVPTAKFKGLGYHLGLVLFSGMAIAFPLLFWINRLVMGRAIADMDTLVAWAASYRRSGDTLPPPEGKFRETQVLSKGFGMLVARLDGAFNEIKDQNRDLEVLVDERTVELKEQHLLLDAILSELPIAVILLDADYSVSYANPKAQKSFAVSTGKPLPPLLRPSLDDERRGQLTSFNGRDYIVGVTRLQDPARVILVATDVTERSAIEEQLLQAQKLESVGRLAGGVAHEFNNALAAILPCVEMLRITVQSERATGYIDSIENAAVKGAEVVRQLLTFSRSGKYTKQPLEINSVIDSAVKMLRPTAKQVEIKWHPRHALPKVLGSEALLQQLLLNLALNALDALDGVGTIEIEAWADRAKRKVFFSVADSGPGISAEVAEHIFDPFFSTKSQEEGTGLGLAVAYGVVERHDGKIRLVSKEGQGAKFEIELPMWEGPEGEQKGGSSERATEDIVIGG
jgi:signal transduction histidine kinase